MTKTSRVTDSSGRSYRLIKQKSAASCGPACCLMMWANIYDADPIADEGGVIALSKKYADAWDATKGANISNLNVVMHQMGVNTKLERCANTETLVDRLHAKVALKKPAMCFLEWQSSATTTGHFVVVGRAKKGSNWANSAVTVLDPLYGMSEISSGLPFYAPDTDADPDGTIVSLQFSGAVLYLD